MTVRITRVRTSPQGTFGAMFIDGKAYCVTGELPKFAGDPAKENECQTDCIPAGTYECKIVNSPKFGRIYEVTKVPNRSAILIHSGNFCGDTAKGYKSHVLGCIILGASKGTLEGQEAVLSSKPIVAAFMDKMKGEPFTLTIEENYG